MAIISDMQQSIIEAVKRVFPGIPHQFCQSHFLKNVGDALTKELHQELGKEIKKAGIQTEVNNIQREMNKKKDEKAKLISDLCLSLKVTTDQPPFDLYYVELVDRYRIVRTAIRKCISLINEEDEYKNALIKLDDKLNIVLRDENIKVRVKQLKYYHRYFRRLCNILDEKRNGKEIREHVEKRVARYRTEIIRLSRNHPKFKKVVFQLDKYWDGLFHTYEYGYIPRTNNDMEKEIWNFQKIWKRITGYNNLNNWINIHGCFSIFLLNFKPEDGKICHQTMGIENESFATLIGSVSMEIRMKNFEKQKSLREEHKTRISIKAKGIKAFLKDKVDKIKKLLKINSD
jgi:hypothetical protein